MKKARNNQEKIISKVVTLNAGDSVLNKKQESFLISMINLLSLLFVIKFVREAKGKSLSV